MSKVVIFGIFIQSVLYSLVLANTGKAQKPSMKDIRVSVEFENESIRRAFQKIEKLTGFEFAYHKLIIDPDKRLYLEESDISLEDLLRTISHETDLGFKRVGEIIYVNKKEPAITIDVFEDRAVGEKNIIGKVTDENGQGLPGVNVVVKGTSHGTVTDVEGNYSLSIPDENAALVFSFVGYVSEEIVVGSETVIDIIMFPDVTSLEEIVVIGYGSLEKRELTNAVTSIRNSDLIPGTNASALMSLQGKVTGLSIVSSNGSDPNSNVSVQLRGANSIHAAQGPLIVIDGVAGGDLNTIPREDIKSIDVLKDASAGAIYGTRASGGVILVTTKSADDLHSGDKGATVSYSTELSVETVRRKAEVLSADEFVEAGLGDDLGHETDWFDVVTNDAPFSQRHVLAMAGGNNTAKVYTSLFYKDAEGMGIGSSREEIGGRMNFNMKALNDIVEVYGHVNYNQAKADFTSNEIFNQALRLNPTETPYNKNDVTGLNVWTGGWGYFNPLADIRLSADKGLFRKLLGSLNLKLNLTRSLSTRAMVAINSRTEHRINWRSSQHKSSRDDGVRGYARQEYKNWEDIMFDWVVNFDKEWGDHSLRAMGGYSYQCFNGEGFWAENQDFPVDGLTWNDMHSGTFLTEGRANLDSWKNSMNQLIGFFGRTNYSLMDKYLLAVSVRYEGSSKFTPENQWGLFPAISGAWRISNESFMNDISLINDLKLRAGFGRTGNVGFASGRSTRMFAPDVWWLKDGIWFMTMGLRHNVNEALKWETKDEINIGIDFSILDNRLSGRFDVYQRESKNLLYDISVSQPPAIHDKTRMNVGSLQNKGIEAELTGVVVNSSKFNYSTTIRASSNRNTLKSLWGSQTFWDRKGFPAPGSPGTAVRLYPGEDIGRFYIWKYAGVSEDGGWLLYDKDGNVFDSSVQSKTVDDKYFIGNAIPNIRLSWENTITWKNFDANLYFRSWIGHDVFNMINMYYGLETADNQNVLRDAFEKNKHITREKELCNYWLENGNFLKLDALTVGYTFNQPAVQKYVKNMRLYFTGRNLFVFTNYSGLDPEVNINGLEPGFEEFSVYPKTRTFVIGFQATL